MAQPHKEMVSGKLQLDALICWENGDTLAIDSQSSEKEFQHRTGFEISNVRCFARTLAKLKHQHEWVLEIIILGLVQLK
ncbi:hypothetical protein IQ274_13195 [Nostoc sp. LEGE 12447]|nr:hypothetical protein [Nostoc sp. LEGE 12447]